jgi:hemerythrin superfamily protein
MQLARRERPDEGACLSPLLPRTGPENLWHPHCSLTGPKEYAMEKENIDLAGKVSEGMEKVKKFLSTEENILSVIREDHKPLKELIKVMKDSGRPLPERVSAFKDFAPLLLTHAKAEEKSLYDFMKTLESDLREEAFEGDTEHAIADQLCEEIKRSPDNDQLSAKIKVLAEMVEHHIQEEENDILPDIEESVDAKILQELTKKYADVQADIIAEGQDDAPPEAEIRNSQRRH